MLYENNLNREYLSSIEIIKMQTGILLEIDISSCRYTTFIGGS